jgi:hypothetical protein
MTREQAGTVILDIFKDECEKPGVGLTNKLVHEQYFRRTESGLGFFEGINYLLERRWLAAMEGQANTHALTKAGWRVDA